MSNTLLCLFIPLCREVCNHMIETFGNYCGKNGSRNKKLQRYPTLSIYSKRNVSSNLIGIDSIISVLQLGHLRVSIRRRYDAHQKHELQRTKKRGLLLPLLKSGPVTYGMAVVDMA